MKKVLALVLALVMILSLAACGGASQTETPKPPVADTPATPDAPATPEAPATPNVPELKGPGNVTLKRLGQSTSFDPNTDIGAQILEEVTGYHAEYYKLPSENADEKLLMELAGGSDYDAVNVNVDQYRTLVAQGALQPLDDLLEVYGQNILNAGHSEAVWDALRGDDGHIYGVPYVYPHPYEIATFMVVRMDLLKAAGIEEVPTTIDEFYNMLVTLKNFYGDEYIIFAGPFKPSSEGNESWVVPKTIASAFGIYNDWMVDENGKVIYQTEHENFDDMINFFSKLQAEGLVDPDWALNTEATLIEKFSSGRAIVAAASRGMVSNSAETLTATTEVTWDDIGYINALKGADGTCKYLSTEAINYVTGIPKTSKNAADVVNWWNIRVAEQLYINIGEEGIHYTLDEKGEIDPINPIFADERGSSYYYLDVTSTEFMNQWPARVRKSAGQWHAFGAVTMNAPDYIEFMPNTFAYMPAIGSFTTYNGTLFGDLQDFILQVMAGTRSIDDLATFKSDWANAGGEDVRADLQGWYDEFYG